MNSTHGHLEPLPRSSPPAAWSPLLNLAAMRGIATRAAVRHLEQRTATHPDLQVAAATVTGSRLRGLDHKGSDVDMLLLTVGRGAKAATVAPYRDGPTGLPMEGQTQELNAFLSKLDTSVPYVEAMGSPALLVLPAYRPYLAGFVVNNGFRLAAHAQRFAYHAACRDRCPVHKAANHVHTGYAVAHGLPTLFDRADTAAGSPRSQLVAHWLTDYAAHRRAVDLARGVDRPGDLPRIEELAAYLRG